MPGYAESTLEIRGLAVGVLDSDPDRDPAERTFVLVHGLGVSSRYFRELADALVRHGRVVSIDLPGFGGTEKPDRTLRIGHYAMVVAEAVEHLGLRDVVLTGHSMGCQVVVEALATRDGIATSGVLMGPVVDTAQRSGPILVLRFLQAVARETPASVTPSLIAWLRTGPRMMIDTFPVMLDYPIEKRIADVRVPLLLIAGERDKMAPPRWLEQLRTAAGEGHTVVERVAGASHQVMVTHPEQVTTNILRLAGVQHG
nr:alpha/beta hydrolase [Tessaracoccus sp. OS52]